MHLPLGIVLAVTLFASVHAQNSLFEIPNVFVQFFDRSAPPPFPFRPPPPQTPFARLFTAPPFGRAPFPGSNGELPLTPGQQPSGFGSGLPSLSQRGPFGGGPFAGGPFAGGPFGSPFGGGRFGAGRGPFGGRRPGPPGAAGRGLSPPFDTLSQILPADDTGAGKTEDKSTSSN